MRDNYATFVAFRDGIRRRNPCHIVRDRICATKQQDAHEFLVALINGIHSHTREQSFDEVGSPRFAMSEGDDQPGGSAQAQLTQCKCCVHLTYSGVFRSDLVCSSCAHSSTAFDPFLDISLSLSTGYTFGQGTGAAVGLAMQQKQQSSPRVHYGVRTLQCILYVTGASSILRTLGGSLRLIEH